MLQPIPYDAENSIRRVAIVIVAILRVAVGMVAIVRVAGVPVQKPMNYDRARI